MLVYVCVHILLFFYFSIYWSKTSLMVTLILCPFVMAKCRADHYRPAIKMTFRWRADSGPILIAGFGFFCIRI